MNTRQKAARRPNRRSLLRDGFAAAAVALTIPELCAASDDDKVRLLPAGKVETEKYPWGDIRWLLSGAIDPRAELTMGIVHFEPNQSNVLHIHPNSAEILYVLSGTSEHLVDGRWTLLHAGDTLRIPRGVPHQARSKDEGFTAVIVYDTPKRIMVPVKESTPPRPSP
jgi:quercetin dioxygenase-like cupin family protein